MQAATPWQVLSSGGENRSSSARINFIAKIYHPIEMAFLCRIRTDSIVILTVQQQRRWWWSSPWGWQRRLFKESCKKWMSTQCSNISCNECDDPEKFTGTLNGVEWEENKNPPEVNVSMVSSSFLPAPSQLLTTYPFQCKTKFNNKQP